MCDYSAKLVAWIDGELSGQEMADVERHCQECGECRTRLEQYQQVSSALNEYCDALAAVKTQPRRLRLLAGLSVAAAAVLAVTVGWILVRSHSERLLVPAPQALAALPAAQLKFPATPSETVHRRHLPKERAQSAPEAANLAPEPAIRITIPAESMFPPGAVPDGINFTADVSFGPDGSARQVRLQPQLTGFERRTIQQ
jgi:anti-sigma factor RsiW